MVNVSSAVLAWIKNETAVPMALYVETAIGQFDWVNLPNCTTVGCAAANIASKLGLELNRPTLKTTKGKVLAPSTKLICLADGDTVKLVEAP
jgi:hypothetical protein